MTEEKKVDIVDAAGATGAAAIAENKDKETVEQIAERYYVNMGFVKLYLCAAQMFEDTSVKIVLSSVAELKIYFRDNIYIKCSYWNREGRYTVSCYKDEKNTTSRGDKFKRRDFDEVVEIIKVYTEKYM